MPTITNPTVTPDSTRKSARTVKPPTRLGDFSPIPVTETPTGHRSIMYTFLVEPAATSDASQDIVYALEEEAARHGDTSEEVDDIEHYHAPSGYSKIDI